MGKGKGNLVAETITKLERLGAVLGLGGRGQRTTTGQEELTGGKDSAWPGGSLVAGRRCATVVVQGSEENMYMRYTAAQRSLEMVKQSDETVGVAGVSFFSDRD